MEKKFFVLFLLFSFFIPLAVHASLVSHEDFENGAFGWSDNNTTYEDSFSGFLGRHGGSDGDQVLFKEYSLSGNQTEVTIEFDFYEIDSWDGEFFNVFIDDSLVSSHSYSFGRTDAYPGTTDIFGGASSPNTNFGFTFWSDQALGYTLTYMTTGTSLKLGFGTTLDSVLIIDESWGIDNVIINDNYSPGGVIPEPGTFTLFGIGILGLAGLAGLKREDNS